MGEIYSLIIFTHGSKFPLLALYPNIIWMISIMLEEGVKLGGYLELLITFIHSTDIYWVTTVYQALF